MAQGAGMKKKQYNYYENDKLNKYVKQQYKNMGKSLLLYLYGLHELEKQQCGLCQPITATHEKLANNSFLSAPTIGKYLLSLWQAGLIEYIPGEQGKRTGNASRIRRRAIKELTGNLAIQLTDYTTATAKQIADILNNRTLNFNSEVITPLYNPKRTGRIYATGILVNKPEKYLKDNLSRGIPAGQYLFYTDYSKAEPTILKHRLEQRGFKAICDDPYKLLSEHLKITRNEAKSKVNSLAYSESAMAIIKHWALPADHYFNRYAKALDQYKDYLWELGTPVKNKKRRHCRTLGGTLIEKNKSESIHKGKLLNWQIQGTVAEVMNNVILEVINLEKEKNWTFLIPVHDAVYIKTDYDCKDEIVEIMERNAKKLNIPLKVKAEKITA
jgi:hypothetical protein